MLTGASVDRRFAIIEMSQSSWLVATRIVPGIERHRLKKLAYFRSSCNVCRTGSELLSRLQAEYPDDYPDKLLRILQRRLKVWRSAQADALLFGPLNKEPPIWR
ncbi:hypothetical protein RFM23_24075 [Mesorhizobium abyssinicae]|uniref:Transposase n=1 Tax=Mesorhizobium abyssinicae TaxID=1209958 RepID=A0ABU5ATT1_9HYPH|nr:hypothetical protein [Mesorhizobium abyssinicae]MDX8540702.1 hypothetical protein [Mesorhizobium abyssinicae]